MQGYRGAIMNAVCAFIKVLVYIIRYKADSDWKDWHHDGLARHLLAVSSRMVRLKSSRGTRSFSDSREN